MKSILDYIVAQQDLVTSVVGLIQLIVVTISQYMASLAGAEINYSALVGSLAVAIVGYYTGKKS